MKPFEITDAMLDDQYEEYLERLEWESLSDKERQKILDDEATDYMANTDDCWKEY